MPPAQHASRPSPPRLSLLRPRPPPTVPTTRRVCDVDHQVVVAAADGCIAAMDIDRYLKNRKKVRVDWIHE